MKHAGWSVSDRPAKVEAKWKASGTGRLLPSGALSDFEPQPPQKPQGHYAVKVIFDGDQSKFPIGAQGATAIYTRGMHGDWAAMWRIGIRTYSWMNWLYPIPFDKTKWKICEKPSTKPSTNSSITE